MTKPVPIEPGSAPRVWAIGGGKGGVGKSVIATNIGGSLDQVLDGVTGFLIPPAW